MFAFQGLPGPAGRPAVAVRKLNAELNKALSNSGVLKRFLDVGMEPMPGKPEQFHTPSRGTSRGGGR